VRHLIACSGCGRQYDATGLAVGTRLPCLCGVGAEVRTPRSHAADVVRCSSCGASREGGSAGCTFCGGDFTLHEQDLHTICPGCLTRISDRARFCHACGVAVLPQPASSAGAARACPACAPRTLVHRAVPGGPPLLECEACLGIWIAPEELRGLLTRAAREGSAARLLRDVGATPPPRAAHLATAQVQYLPCPLCATRMNRRRFPGRAGVIVDTCQDHGLWFEARELERVLDAAAQGLAPAAVPGDAERERAALRREVNRAWSAEGPLRHDGMPDLVQGALKAIGRLLGRWL
jgi:Zn-finger nucleic acid-binding protein